MKTTTQLVFCLFIVLCQFNVSGQTSPCTSNTPHFTIDLTGEPGGTAFIAPVARQGLCCGAQSPAACIMATITLDSNSSGIRFDIASGAVPPGALYYQIGCGPQTKVGEAICLNGVGPHILTFCKPGNNQNGYSITALPKSIIPDTVSVDVGCSVEIGTLGYFVNSSLIWKDLTSNDSSYLSYLNCTVGCDTVTVTPDHNAPAYIQYEVCGQLIDTVCQAVSSYLCKTVTVQINSIKDSTTASICDNESYALPDGTLANTSGWYLTPLASASGCDSLVYTLLEVQPTYLDTVRVVECDSALVRGAWYFSSQFLTHNFQSINACDSIIVTDLTINYRDTTFIDIVSCEGAMVRGIWYNSSQNVINHYSTTQRCDSVVVTRLTINYEDEVSETLSGCDSVNFNGSFIYTDETFTHVYLNSLGCDSVHNSTIDIHSSFELYNQVERCLGQAAMLPNGRYVYTSGDYTTFLQTEAGCDSVLHTQVTINSTGYEPVGDTAKCLGGEIMLSAGDGQDLVNYYWSTGEQSPSIYIQEVGTYYLTVESSNGCSSKDTIRVIDADCPACPVYTPNAFTRNGDGLNEGFKPVSECVFQEYSFQVYNRWGELLLKTSDPTLAWDGTYLNTDVQQGVYVWLLYYVDQVSQKPISQSGTLTLLR